MMITKKAIPRRTMLRGVGATLALPLLDGMVPALTAMAKTPARRVARFCAVYVPNGIIMKDWTPAAEGSAFELSPTLKPLEAHRRQLLVLSGLDNTGASSRTGNPGSHAKPAGAFLTGVEPLQTTSSSSLDLGISMDQILAKTISQDTPLPSLELGLEGADTVNGVGTCGVGFNCAYQNTLAWASPSTPLPVEPNPRVVFERLFGDIESTDPAARSARLRRQSSILDSVLDKVRHLHGEVGRRDQRKLDEYVDSVREIERRIQNAEANGRKLPLVDSPAGIPVDCDRQKIASLQRINAYHVSLLGYFLDKLAATADGGGSVLDNAVILYGSAISEGNRHDSRNLPLLLAGGAGGRIESGRHLRYPRGTQRLTNLQLTLLNTLGVPAEQFGDSTGEQLGELSGVARATTDSQESAP